LHLVGLSMWMELEGSSMQLQVPATCPCPKPAWSSPYAHIQFLMIHLNIIPPSMPGSPKWSLSLRFPHQNPVYTSPHPMHATWPANFILLDFITQTILGEKYRSLSSTLCSFLHSSVTLSLLGSNILLSTPFSNTQPLFLPQCEWPSFTPTKNNRQNYSFVYLNL